MVSYEQLAGEHAAIDGLIAKLLIELDACPPQPERAIEILRALVSELNEHLATEDCTLYPRLLASNDVRSSATAAQFLDDLEILRIDWRDFVIEWSGEAITYDWREFTGEARVMLARLRARVRDENELLYPAALQRSAITFRQVVAA